MRIWKSPQTFSEWLVQNSGPDLQALVQQYGGYSKIPQEAWRRFDRDMARWKAAYARRHEEEQ